MNEKRNNGFRMVLCMIFVLTAVVILLPRTASKAGNASAESLVSIANNQGGKKATDFGFSSNWCAWFVEWCGDEAGLVQEGVFPRKGSYGTVTDLCNWFIDNDKGTAYYALPGALHTSKNAVRISRSSFEPQKGDLITFTWDGVSDERYDHIGIVTGYSNGTVYFTHGNTGGNSSGSQAYWQTSTVKVNSSYSRTNSVIAAYIRPNYSSGYNPQGCFDICRGEGGAIVVYGWAFDRDDVSKNLKVHVYVGGPAGSGAEGYEITANTIREDVNNAFPGVGNYHGFEANLSVNSRGNQPIYVYAINVGSGTTNTLLDGSPKTVYIPEPNDIDLPTIKELDNCEVAGMSFNFYGEGINRLRYTVEDDDICSCEWGEIDWSNKIANLKVLGKKAGQTTVKIEYLDESENSFYMKSFDVKVSVKKEDLRLIDYNLYLNTIENPEDCITVDFSKAINLKTFNSSYDNEFIKYSRYEVDNENKKVYIYYNALKKGETYINLEFKDKYLNIIAAFSVEALVFEPEPTATPKPTVTPEPTATPKPTATPEPTATQESYEISLPSMISLSEGEFKDIKISYSGNNIKRLGCQAFFETICECNLEDIDLNAQSATIRVLGKKEGTTSVFVTIWNNDGYSVAIKSFNVDVTALPETPTPTAIVTPMPAATETPTPTATVTPAPAATETPTPTATETPTPTATETPTLTAIETPTPTVLTSDTDTTEYVDDDEEDDEVDEYGLEEGDTFEKGGLVFTVTDIDEVSVSGIVSKEAKTVKIPVEVGYNGNIYEVVAIDEKAFKGNKKITKVTINADLIEIGDSAFEGCSSLKSLYINGDLEIVGRKAFYKCSLLKKIVIKSDTIEEIEKNAFAKINKKATVTVPKAVLKEYKKLLKNSGLPKKSKVKK